MNKFRTNAARLARLRAERAARPASARSPTRSPAPVLDSYLKRWGARVSVNDPARWAWIEGVARVENNDVRLTRDDLDTLLEDVYVPRHRLRNPALRRWFGESDAWWFDNYRENADRLTDDVKRPVASTSAWLRLLPLSLTTIRRYARALLARPPAHPESAPPSQQAAHGAPTGRAPVPRRAADDLLFLRLPAPARAASARTRSRRGREEGCAAARTSGPASSPAGRRLAARALSASTPSPREELLEAARTSAVGRLTGRRHVQTEDRETLRLQRKVETVTLKTSRR